MNTIGILFIIVYFILIFLVLEIAVALFVITGLEPEVARFQVVSMLTSTGFTTKESELIARHPIRRKISVFLILFGVFSLAVIIALITRILAENFRILNLIAITGLFAIILLIIKSKAINLKLTQRFHEHLQEQFEIHELPVQETLYISEDDLFVGIQFDKESPHIHKKFQEVVSAEDDILLLYLRRGEEKMREKMQSLIIREGDVLFVYGSRKQIEAKFHTELNKMRNKHKDEQEVAAL